MMVQKIAENCYLVEYKGEKMLTKNWLDSLTWLWMKGRKFHHG